MGCSPSRSPANETITEDERAAFNKAISSHVELGNSAFLYTSKTIQEAVFTSCFELVALTSAGDYRASSKGWSPNDKLAEMRDSTMRYIVVRKHETEASSEEQSATAGFLSYMLTEEDGHLVVYIYEVHVMPAWRGRGIGFSLIQVAEAIGAAMRMEKVMLTVFTKNESARRLYERLAYVKWDEEPVTKKRLRSGTKESKPTYLILAKNLDRTASR